jgi:L-fuculose-phosphate aldolase
VREDVLAAAKEMAARNLVEGTAGNVSARLPDGNVCITPSSVSYESMALDDLVVIDLDGNKVAGDRSPSSEKSLHLACYRAFDDVQAVIHSHPVYATMFAITHQPIPACIDEVTIYVGGDVPVADYGASGTDELGGNVVAKLKGLSAVLMANHGLVTVGANPHKALHVAALVDRTAQIVWGARLLGREVPLPDSVNKTFKDIYGFLRANPDF